MPLRMRERGLFELYQDDPERADALVFGRRAHSDRRGFLRGAGLATMGAMLGAAIPFHRSMPSGLIPAALAEETELSLFEAKDGLTLLNDRPVNAETPPHLLDDSVTPNARHFVRNNGTVPDMALGMNAEGWRLTVDGAVDTPLELTLDDLRNRFEVVTLKLQLECGGNGRAAFNPPAKGNQWTLGAIGKCGVDRRALCRRAEGRRREERGDLYRALRHGRPPLGQSRQAGRFRAAFRWPRRWTRTR